MKTHSTAHLDSLRMGRLALPWPADLRQNGAGER